MARGQAWGRWENTSWPGKEWSLGGRAFTRCVRGWEDSSSSLHRAACLTQLFSFAFSFPLYGQTITIQASDSNAPLARMLIVLGFLHFIRCSLASSGVAILQVWGHSPAVWGNYTPQKPSQAVPCLHPRLTLNRFR